MSDTLQFVAGQRRFLLLARGLPAQHRDKLKCVGQCYVRRKLTSAFPTILLMALMLVGVAPLDSTIASVGLAKKTFRVMTQHPRGCRHGQGA